MLDVKVQCSSCLEELVLPAQTTKGPTDALQVTFAKRKHNKLICKHAIKFQPKVTLHRLPPFGSMMSLCNGSLNVGWSCP